MAGGDLGPGGVTTPRVGVDEWVANVDERREAQRGLTGLVRRGWGRVPPAGRLLILLGPFAIFPFVTNRGGTCSDTDCSRSSTRSSPSA